MAYTALYRKFRPLTFSEMVGQEHITRTLKNQIIAGRVGHAYLLNGVRGTGKTSAAKILARAINCLNPKDGEPCNECEICKAALSGSLTDIVEMDAASNNSVEDIRQIREEVNFLPTLAKYRVYIIDEVHMLSTGAFNALLKTLEEPPEHVKFILATTEPQKLPATILSRCQRFDFKKIPDSDIIKRLEIVCEKSEINITKEALKIIANLSEGALRDALSILERCVQDGNNEIDEAKVKELVGIPKLESIAKITSSIIQYQAEECLDELNVVIEQGKDVVTLLWELVKYIRDILLYKTTKQEGIYSKEEIEELKKLSDQVSKERLIQLIYSLSELENNMKWSSQKLIVLQSGLIGLCSKRENYGLEEIEKRISILENNIKELQTRPNTVVVKETENNNGQMKENKKEASRTEKLEVKIGKKDIKPNEEWKKLIVKMKENGKIMLYTNLLGTTIKEINDMTIGIYFPNGLTAFGKTVLEKPDTKMELEKELSMIYGKEMKIKLIDEKAEIKVENNTNEIENLAKEMDIPIQIIDE
ncbi:MAG TPA: DNA polymerase III subunit gamma/tau [Candidatus Merdicola faecigallinarum]|uniref:DNA-directed DNA polymerase n=1 Tax=Candidatus Merdicola faecigallinarum TaxID=2840862 RepID=A0A9D1S9C0_9FIRM|nr:DNA polymerase III subunit gamma/tau [Candidatus Merdicola faecigallinarum]